MITGLQLALTGGGLIGLGLALLVWRLAPAHPELADVLSRTSHQAARRRRLIEEDQTGRQQSTQERVGLWSMRRLPGGLWNQTPTKELALLRIPVQQHYGRKVLQGLLGLVLLPLLTLFFAALGFSLPVLVPTAGSLVLAALLFLSPDAEVRTKAKRARAEFTRALSAYLDLVALERNSGSGARQAMEVAATTGDSWVFQRISEALARSRWEGQAPWDALHALSEELGLPELDDLADIMRLSGEGAQVYSNLRARSASLRGAMLNEELAKANATNQRMRIPQSLLGVVFIGLLIGPSLLRVTAA